MINQQPKGLYLLCFTELWERFGFYTVQTILILYMSKGLLFSDYRAYLLYGTFSALLYLTPVLGGFVADRYIGFQRSIILGGLLFVLSYLLCALPGQAAFFWGLTFLIIGNGFLKPNVSSIVGELYEKDDPRRDGGFTLFYMGINIGALIPPIFAGDLVHQHGWHSGFLLAAVGMFIGLISFIYGRYRLQGKGGVPKGSPLYRQLLTYLNRIHFLLACTIVICAFIIHALFKIPTITSTVLIIASILIVLWVLIIALRESDDIRNKMIAALILTVISVGFWALYNQTFTSLMLFAERNMQPNFLGMTINAEFTHAASHGVLSTG